MRILFTEVFLCGLQEDFLHIKEIIGTKDKNQQ